MEAENEVLRTILQGVRPVGVDLSGVTLDGKVLPKRERVAPWDLAGISMRGAVLTRLDLSGACFAGADISGAAFRNVNLSAADFQRVSASGAVFEDINLAYATFRGADLRGSSFSFANLADINFKDADMRGASVNGVRFSLNGKTHVLGLKDALIHRYRDVTYPFVVGVSGDAFWLSYLTEPGDLVWGGFARETLTRGLTACGFESEIVNELDVEEAWRRLTKELEAGRGVITPLHVGRQQISGSGFGGSEWVYVSAYDSATNGVLVRCLLGDDLAYSWDDFVRAWCIHHPLETVKDRIVYTLCIIGERSEEVSLKDATLRGIAAGLEILELGEHPEHDAVCGLSAYDLLLRDLDVDPAVGEGCSWLGLGLMHHHGSRWAIRDFLVEAREHLGRASEEDLKRAIDLYEQVLENLAAVLRLLPGSITPGGVEREEAVRTFIANRDEASAHLRSARSREEEARDALATLL